MTTVNPNGVPNYPPPSAITLTSAPFWMRSSAILSCPERGRYAISLQKKNFIRIKILQQIPSAIARINAGTLVFGLTALTFAPFLISRATILSAPVTFGIVSILILCQMVKIQCWCITGIIKKKIWMKYSFHFGV